MESQEVKSRRTKEVIRRLKKEFPSAKTALCFSNPLELLISTILSAQCTDARVNLVTPNLFTRYKSATHFANADRNELELIIRSTGFFHSKAKSIIGACQMLVERYHGIVPKTMEELTSLPGVGRKTANCVLSGAYGIQSGFVVDTHVIRLSQRLGLTKNDSPEKIEQDLMGIVVKKDWYYFSNLLIQHGRKTCKARNSNCSNCILLNICPFPRKN
jgi:endonuclease-3